MAVIPRLALAAAAEAFLITIFFPQYLPHNPFVWTLIRTLAANFGIFAFYKVLIYPYFITPFRHLPKPNHAGYPLLGQQLALFRRPPGQDFLKWMNEVPNDGLIFFRGIANQPRLLLTNPRTLAEVLVHKSYDYQKPTPLRNFLRRILGDGLIIVEGEEHKFQRKHIMPVFSFRHIKDLYPMMWKKAVALTQCVAAEMADNTEPGTDEDGRPTSVVEVNHWSNKVTMDIIGVAGLGREFNALKNSDDELIKNYEEILEPTAEKLLYFACQILLPQALVNRLPWKLNERVRTITRNLNRICGELVQEKRRLIKANADDNLDILSVLLKSDNFSDQQLVDQLLTFLAAGHETTSSAFTWVTYLLAKNQNVQDRLRKEVREAIPSAPGPEVDLALTLESLPLLNAVCNETIRLYPTVPITVRHAIRDTTIGDLVVPNGTEVLLCPWAINRAPHLWGPDAGEFVPDRWIDSNTGKPNNTGGASSNYSILTFLHGPRSCIGKDFAKAELRCLVAAFVSAFEWDLANKDEIVIPSGVITTKPGNGMSLRLRISNPW